MPRIVKENISEFFTFALLTLKLNRKHYRIKIVYSNLFVNYICELTKLINYFYRKICAHFII